MRVKPTKAFIWVFVIFKARFDFFFFLPAAPGITFGASGILELDERSSSNISYYSSIDAISGRLS